VIDGEEALEVVDLDAPLTGRGQVALRSDNVAVTFDDVDVRETA
jgi:hypothetical protein